jgi:predicted transposase YbfD/YdcC
VPKLLEISGCIVTADAMNCQRIVAKKAIEKGADYVLVHGSQATW